MGVGLLPSVQALDDFGVSLALLQTAAARVNVSLHLRYIYKTPIESFEDTLAWMVLSNLISAAVDVCLFRRSGVQPLGVWRVPGFCFADGHSAINTVPSLALMAFRGESPEVLQASFGTITFVSVAVPQVLTNNLACSFFLTFVR
jgi:hypothetical protein